MDNKHYILRDKQEIFGIYSTLEQAYISLLQFIYNFYRYSKYISDNNINSKIFITQFQIISYTNNIINNIYNLNYNYNLLDFNSEILELNSIAIMDFLTKISLINDDLNVDSNDLNLFIPINFTETEKKNNINIDNINIDEIKKKLDKLQQDKESHLQKINDEKNKLKQKEEQFLIEKMKTERLKQQINNKTEKYEKLKNKFKIDKNIYFQIKNEIDSGNRSISNLPELFINEFNIFDKLNQDNILTNSNSELQLNEYIKQKNNIEYDTMHHINNKYDELFNNIKWNSFSDQQNIENFNTESS
jgi:hypothetical protein